VEVVQRPLLDVEPIRATRTFEAAIENLTEAIERSGLRAGDRLPGEYELAGRLGISRPTLRQAVRVLELSGVVDVRRGKNGGIFLATELIPTVAVSSAVALEESAAAEALRARRVLEAAVTKEAALRADADDYAQLGRACHNRQLESAMRGIAKSLAPIRDAYSGGIARDRQTLDVHERQLAAMRDRDSARLETVLDEHFRMLEESFADAIGSSWTELFGT
jgi:GntR family transcriptional regulator, transcriptional repressor for pyruvate dehydrogenase complex